MDTIIKIDETELDEVYELLINCEGLSEAFKKQIKRMRKHMEKTMTRQSYDLTMIDEECKAVYDLVFESARQSVISDMDYLDDKKSIKHNYRRTPNLISLITKIRRGF